MAEGDFVEDFSEIEHELVKGDLTVTDAQTRVASAEINAAKSIQAATGDPTVEIKGEIVTDPSGVNSIKLTVENGGKSVPLQVETSDGKVVELTSAIADPSISAEEVASSVVDNFKNIGAPFPAGFETGFAERISNNPERAGTEVKDNYTDMEEKYKDVVDLGAQYEEAKNAGKPTSAIDQQISEKAMEAVTSKVKSSLIEDMKNNPDKYKDLVDKSETDGKKGFDYKWILLAGLGGFLGYEFLKAMADRMSGCWKFVSDGKTVTKCKVTALTCDTNAKTNGSLCPSATLACRKDITTSNNCDQTCVTNCQQQNWCTDGGLCSKYCDISYLGSDEQGNQVSYVCIQAGIGDAIEDIAQTAADIAGQVVDSSLDLWKWFTYILIGLGVVVAVIVAYKLFTSLTSSGK